MWLVHIAGEGLADPPIPRPFPANLVNFNDGPAIYNLRAPFEGALHAPDWCGSIRVPLCVLCNYHSFLVCVRLRALWC